MMEIIEKREKVYGSFEDIAKVSQSLKATMFTAYEDNDPVVCEALDMIMHKLARIGSKTDGWKNIDNWRDIAGYAQLVVNYLQNDALKAIDSEVYYKEKISGIWSEPKRSL